jgi:hypothetical protein
LFFFQFFNNYCLLKYFSRESGSPQTALFIIERVTREDEGVYVCTARNPAGESEDRLNVIVEIKQQQPSPPIFPPFPIENQMLQIDRTVYQVPRGVQAEMTCRVITRGKNNNPYCITLYTIVCVSKILLKVID